MKNTGINQIIQVFPSPLALHKVLALHLLFASGYTSILQIEASASHASSTHEGRLS